MFSERWSRDLHGRWLSVLKHNDGILVTERLTFLSRINISNGETEWEVKVLSINGHLSAFENTVYYLEYNGLLRCINFNTGKVEREQSLQVSFLGFAAIYKNYLVTGSWRGYTNLHCLNFDENMSINWIKPTKSKTLKSYSIPKIQNGYLIQVNTTSKFIWKIELKTGKQIWNVRIPENVGDVDKDYSFGFSKGTIVMYTKDGNICVFNEDIKKWEIVIVHTCGIHTVKPRILNNQYIFQDSENYICSYDINSKELRWKIYSNHSNLHIAALDLNAGKTLLGFNMSKQLIITEDGDILKSSISEKRYGSEFIKIKDGVIYLTKSELKLIKEV